MGERVANQLLSPNMLNYIELSKEYNIEEIIIPSRMAEKSLRELDIRAKYNVSAIAIVREGDIIISPSPDQIIHKGDLLVVIGNREDLARIFKYRIIVDWMNTSRCCQWAKEFQFTFIVNLPFLNILV